MIEERLLASSLQIPQTSYVMEQTGLADEKGHRDKLTRKLLDLAKVLVDGHTCRPRHTSNLP